MTLLIFNKRYREETKIIDFIATKLKKSKTLTQTTHSNYETYIGDGFILDFHLTFPCVIEWRLKENHDYGVTYRMNCEYDQYNKMAKVRWNWFTNLLKNARQRTDPENLDIKMREHFDQTKKRLQEKQSLQMAIDQIAIENARHARGK
ncbi:MAG: hypothetical protein MJ187_04800 [Alphaproteobacteria bacterium]|nr:hypothetical protein [Alphaproteobacteria bacterium]